MLAKAATLTALAVLLAAPAFAQDYLAPPPPPAPPPAPAPPPPPTPVAPTFAAISPVPPLPPTPPAPWQHSIWIEDGKRVEWADMSPEKRAKFEAKMKALDDKLARLNQRLVAENAERQAHVKEIVDRAMARAQEALKRAQAAQLAPERIHDIKEHARASVQLAQYAELNEARLRQITEQAERQAEAGMRTAEQAQRMVQAMKPELDRMQRELDHMKWNDDK